MCALEANDNPEKRREGDNWGGVVLEEINTGGGRAHAEQQPKILNSSWQMTRFKLDVKLPDFHPTKRFLLSLKRQI